MNTEITLTQNADGTYDGRLSGVSVNVVPYVAPVEVAAPPPPIHTDGLVLSVDKPTVMVGDYLTLTQMLYKGGVGSPVGTLRVYGYDTKLLSAANSWTPQLVALAPGTTTIKSDYTGGLTASVAVTVIANDGTVFPPPPSKAPAPAPPVGSGPAPAPAGSPPPVTVQPATEPPAPPAPPADKAHTVVVTATDPTGPVWSAQVVVGEDWTVAGCYKYLRDAAGNAHPGITAKFYSDGVDVGADRGDNGSDFLGWALSVTYDGAVVFEQASVNFYRGTLNKTLRYGPQAPWHPVDPSLFPNWAKGSPKLPDFSKYDFSYNGMGAASTGGMATTGDRIDIAFAPGWDVPFCVNPSDASFALVRQAADNDGAWAICFRDPNTGQPYDLTQYPNATTQPKATGIITGNPIAPYNGGVWAVSGSPLAWDQPHQTGYAFVAAAATGSARDKDHAAIHANAPLIWALPSYRQTTGLFTHYQERGTAWALRSIFLGAHVSSMPDYFAGQLAIQRQFADALPGNPLHFMATYVNRDSINGAKTGVAIWEENYVRIVVDVIANKQPEWQTLNIYLAGGIPLYLARNPDSNANTYAASTAYAHVIKNADGTFIDTADEMYLATLQDGKWSLADAQAFTAPGVTADAADTLLRAHGFANKKGDLMQYVASSGGYPALMRAASAGAMDAGVANGADCWALMESLPTKPDFSADWRFNIVPRTAA